MAPEALSPVSRKQLRGRGVVGRMPLAAQVGEQIARAIISGEFRPGQWITEEELCTQYGVSRSPVREALRHLAAEGLVTIAPRRGASVSQYDARLISDLYECRALLEPQCFRIAVPHFSSQTMKELEGHFNLIRRAARRADPEAYNEAILRFHETIHASCPNAVLQNLIRILWHRVLLFRYIIVHLPGRLPTSFALHRRIYRAILQGDGALAAQAVRELIQDSYHVLIKALHPQLKLPVDSRRASRMTSALRKRAEG